MNADSTMVARVAELRRAFDESFAAPRLQPGVDTIDLLVIRVGHDRYALRLTELCGLQVQRKVVPLPGLVAPAVGVAGFRGKIVPVYSLAGLLGYGVPRHEPWLALAGHEELPIALAFAAFEGHHRPALHAIRPASQRDVRAHVGEAVTLEGGACRVISVPSVLQTIARATATAVTR